MQRILGGFFAVDSSKMEIFGSSLSASHHPVFLSTGFAGLRLADPGFNPGRVTSCNKIGRFIKLPLPSFSIITLRDHRRQFLSRRGQAVDNIVFYGNRCPLSTALPFHYNFPICESPQNCNALLVHLFSFFNFRSGLAGTILSASHHSDIFIQLDRFDISSQS